MSIRDEQATRHTPVGWPNDGVDNGAQLRLVSTDGTHWAGEVPDIARFLMRHIIGRHYPIPGEMWAAVIVPEDDGDGFIQVAGHVREVTDDHVIFIDDVRVPFIDIVSVEV